MTPTRQPVEEFLESGGGLIKLPIIPSDFPRKSDLESSERGKKKPRTLRMKEKKRKKQKRLRRIAKG